MANHASKNSSSKGQAKQKKQYENKHKTPEDARIDGPNRPAE